MIETTILRPITISIRSRISEDHSLERVGSIGQIGSVGHVNDILRLHSSLDQVVISTARITRDGIVAPTISSSHDHSILLSRSNSGNESNQKIRSSHT